MAEHTERCHRCKGRGHRWFTVEGQRTQVTCGTCHGVGEKTYAASAEQRAKTNAKAKERKMRKLEESINAFKIQNADIAAWLEFSQDSWAIKMRDALAKYGNLTEPQMKVTQKLARMNKGILE